MGCNHSPISKIYGDLATPQLKLGYRWVITLHSFMWILLVAHAVNPMLVYLTSVSEKRPLDGGGAPNQLLPFAISSAFYTFWKSRYLTIVLTAQLRYHLWNLNVIQLFSCFEYFCNTRYAANWKVILKRIQYAPNLSSATSTVRYKFEK